jgi:hypothetical protein
MNSEQRRRNPKGFILLVMVGLMAVMLIVVIGFLSNTRSEVTYVTGMRNQTECNNALQSALDFTIGAIVHDTFKGNQMDSDKPVALVRDAKNPFKLWWYKPSIEMDRSSVGSSEDQADWVYLPANFTADGVARVRVRVQVSDTNGCINSNGWLDSGIPTQAQMGNMLIETCDYGFAERARASLLNTYSPAYPAPPTNGGTVLPAAKYDGGPFNCPGAGHAVYDSKKAVVYCPYHAYPMKPRRYLDCWRAASRTYSGSGANYKNWYRWATLNEPYFADIGAGQTIEMIYSSSQGEHGIDTSFASYEVGYYLFQQGSYAVYHTCYTDPDTGRSPINVNTGVPYGYMGAKGQTWNQVGALNYQCYVPFDRVMKAVFNINSMKHLIRMGTVPVDKSGTKYRVPANALYESPLSATIPAGAALSTWTAQEIDTARKKVEQYRAKLAYQYQETLVRYFNAYYNAYKYWPYDTPQGFPYYPSGFTKNDETYPVRYKALGAANSGAGQVKYFCPSYKQEQPRFPFGLDQFRQNVKDDLTAMTVHARNPAFNDGSPAGLESESGMVNVDDNFNFEISPGKLDRRIATAIFDNIVPGPQTLWSNTDPVKYPSTPEEQYPIKQLYDMKLARDENSDVWYTWPEMEGSGTVPIGPSTPGPTASSTGFPKSISGERGRIIALSGAPGVGVTGKELGPWEARDHIPERQYLFSPDCFSTELTTSTTTYVIIVCAELVDTSKDLANPSIIFSRHVAYTVEVAPDVKNETNGAGNWAVNGLGYYKAGLPRKRLTDPGITDDKLTTLPIARNDNNGQKIKGSDTSAALDWFDFRGVQAGQESTFYDSPAQTKRKVLIRRVCDFSFDD